MGLFGHNYKKNKVDVPNEVKTETADDENYILRTAEEAMKITEVKRKEIKEKQEKAKRKKLAEFPNSDEFKRLIRCINTRISFGDDHIIVHGYDCFILKSFFEPYGYVVTKLEGVGTLISWTKDDEELRNFLEHTG